MCAISSKILRHKFGLEVVISCLVTAGLLETKITFDVQNNTRLLPDPNVQGIEITRSIRTWTQNLSGYNLYLDLDGLALC